MAFDNDNNFAVSGVSGEGLVSTDFVSGAHHQVVKLAYGNSTTATRVQDDTSSALPVKVNVLPTLTVNSVTNAIKLDVPSAGITVQAASTGFVIRGLTGGDPSGPTFGGSSDHIRVYGVSGGYPVAVTGSNLGIRGLTGGDPAGPTFGGSSDHIRVYGVSGGYPIGVTATNLGIRSLTGGNPAGATLVGSADHIRVYGVSGGWPVGVTATNFGIRSLTGGNPTEATPSTTVDVVRVIGYSGGWPVETLLYGLSGGSTGSRLPLIVDSSGNLRVSVAVGTIGVTATVSGVTLSGAVTIAGLSLSAAATGPTGWASQVLQVQGYKFGWTGGGQTLGWQPIPILTEVTGSFPVRGLTWGTDSIAVTGGVAVNGTVSVSGFTGTNLAALASTVSGGKVQTQDTGLNNISTTLGTVSGNVSNISIALGGTQLFTDADQAGTALPRRLNVRVVDIAQPDGITSGKISVTNTLSNLSNASLKSGVHFKSDLNNTTSTIFIATSGVAANTGYPLYNGDQIFIETDNLNRIWVQSTSVSGATLYYIGT